MTLAERAHREHAAEVAHDSRIMRAHSAHESGGCGTPRCGSCGRYLARPSDVCAWCGNDPVTHHGDRRAYDRAHRGQ